MILNIFGPNNALLYPHIEMILAENIGKRYFIMNHDEWARIISNSRGHGNRIFWFELLNAVHHNSIVNLLRTKKWVDAILISYERKNLLSFCASLRGLIEFGADAHFTFDAIPSHLAEEFDKIKSVFKEDRTEIIINNALEDALLHFSYAGTQMKKNVRSKVYNAKPVKHYIDHADKGGKLYDFYQYLSGFVHPSTESVTSYLNLEKHEIGEYLKVEMND